jgi:hypothetical protein
LHDARVVFAHARVDSGRLLARIFAGLHLDAQHFSISWHLTAADCHATIASSSGPGLPPAPTLVRTVAGAVGCRWITPQLLHAMDALF